MGYNFSREELKKEISAYLKLLYRKDINDADNKQMYHALSYALKDDIVDKWMATHREYIKNDVKTVYYLSMEFLSGRALGNMMINLRADDIVKDTLNEIGFDLNAVEDEEPDAALGSGGLGRLAACFLDSLSSLGYPAVGCGIRYRHGLFRQKIENGYQVEHPDKWLENANPIEMKRPESSVIVTFGGGQCVKAIPYDIPIPGYDNNVVNTLRIWDAEAVDDFNLDEFDKGEYHKAVEQANLAKSICEVLYPNDSHRQGKALRLKQQYFFVSASIMSAVKHYMDLHDDIRNLHEKVCFQLNDTHPATAVPELMRILMDEYGLEWDEAWEITGRCCAYTNHTIMGEALETWPIGLYKELLPRIHEITEEISRRFEEKIKYRFPCDENKFRTLGIMYDGRVRMANLLAASCFSVNGVASLHTEILKHRVLRDFYELFPDKFNNKTNGITHRRFLLHANPLLSDYITTRIGRGWITDPVQLESMARYIDDAGAINEFMEIRHHNKLRLAEYIKVHNGITVNPDSIFDIQIKRIHEYKRQLLNILHIMYLYNELKNNPSFDMYPRIFIFGGKAAAGYRRAKLIIKLINNVAKMINSDHSVNSKIKVVFIENYCVSNAEIMFAAADVSEQISTAGREASGTGNMKFMLNGAVTIGTLDGANVEIAEAVGEDNIFIFGMNADETAKLDREGTYDPAAVYNSDERIKRTVNMLIDGTFSDGDRGLFAEIFNSLINNDGYERPDRYYVLKDFASYHETQMRLQSAYADRIGWTKKSMYNMAKSGRFSSDRTIEEYVRDIWHLEKVNVPDE